MGRFKAIGIKVHYIVAYLADLLYELDKLAPVKVELQS